MTDTLDTPTPRPMAGIWTLTAPDGRTWKADTPIRCVAAELRERVPAAVAMARIRAAADEGRKVAAAPVAAIDTSAAPVDSGGGHEHVERIMAQVAAYGEEQWVNGRNDGSVMDSAAEFDAIRAALVQAFSDLSPLEMWLCESQRLVLRADQVYRFKVDPSCEACKTVERGGTVVHPWPPAHVPAPAGWLPIASAPKDGTPVIVTNPLAGGSWIAHWAPFAQSGFRFDQPWRSCMLNHDHIPTKGRYLPPTHYQPLPTPPATEGVA